jgi:hypothetical protein
VGHVHPQPGHAAVQPEPDHVLEQRGHVRVMPVLVGPGRGLIYYFFTDDPFPRRSCSGSGI